MAVPLPEGEMLRKGFRGSETERMRIYPIRAVSGEGLRETDQDLR
jgi:hypothetical protein